MPTEPPAFDAVSVSPDLPGNLNLPCQTVNLLVSFHVISFISCCHFQRATGRVWYSMVWCGVDLEIFRLTENDTQRGSHEAKKWSAERKSRGLSLQEVFR